MTLEQHLQLWSSILSWVWFGVDVVLRIAALAIIPYNRRPTASIAWLLVIMVQPIVGWLIFAVFGSNRLPRQRRERMRAIDGLIEESSRDIDDADISDGPPWLEGVVQLNRTLSKFPLVDDNTASLHSEFHETVQAMVEAIDQATHHVHVEFYLIVSDDSTEPFFQALERARQRGVTVRVLQDYITVVRYPRRSETVDRYTAMGAIWHDMLPFRLFKRPDLRNHRKMLLIDGTVGFTGSLNMIDPSYLKRSNIRRGLQWKDLMVRFDGPIVQQLEALFVADWWIESGELLPTPSPSQAPRGELEPARRGIACSAVPSGPGFDGENNLRLFSALLYDARDRAVIVSPYFVPDDSIMYAITSAALRGVHVELFASEIGDQFFTYHAQRSYYETLLRAGVEIWLYRAPIILHSKHITIDDNVAVIGSSNIDLRSFALNFEVSVFAYSSEFVRQVREVEDDYRAHCRRLTLDEWTSRGVGVQVLDNVSRLTSSLQ